MTLNLTLLFVFGLAPVQFLFRNRQNLFHGTAEFIGWPLDLVGGCRHVVKSITQDLERKAYKSQLPTTAMIKSPRNSLLQSIE
jgi:hypothetical protein